ncbi:MAG: hypothetical protein OER74_15690, partial [Desulfobacteraceae bacterium]|nr:hypothetical protein [Desulfobacteraceae bacterium]
SRKNETEMIMDSIQNAGIDIARIGEVMEAGRGVEAVSKAGPANWPSFEVDEITRLYSNSAK